MDHLGNFHPPELDPAQESRIHAYMLDLSQKAGLAELPTLEEFQPA